MKTFFKLLIGSAFLFHSGCYYFKIDQYDRLVPKNPRWELKDSPRVDASRIDFDAIYIGKFVSTFWFMRFWENGQVKIYSSEEYSEWFKMEERNFGGIGYFSLDKAGNIEVEYFSAVAQGFYVTAIGFLREDGSIEIDRLTRRSGESWQYPMLLRPEIDMPESNAEWNWVPDW